MRATFRIVPTLLLTLALALPALAQEEEPYTGETVPDTAVDSDIEVLASGLTATFSIPGADSCTWDFGDGEAGEGNPVSHTYAEEGPYQVTAVCASATYTISVVVGSLALTGTEGTTYLTWGGGLLLVGLVLVSVARREEA